MRQKGYVKTMEVKMIQAFKSLELKLDEYTVLGGIDLNLAKSYINENGNNATTWAFYTSSGSLFRAMLYWVEEDASSVPYLFAGHYLGDLPVNTEELLNYLVKSNMNIYDPLKFATDQNEVVLILRTRADKIDPEYIRDLLLVMNHVADGFINVASRNFGFICKAEGSSVSKRMVQ